MWFLPFIFSYIYQGPLPEERRIFQAKQTPVKMGDRTIYRTLSPQRTPFQTGIDRWSHLWKVPRRGWISHIYPMWLWGHILFKISSPGPVLLGTRWVWVWVLCYDRRSAGQSVLEHSTHLGLTTRSLLHVWQLRSCSCGAPSLTIGRVCPLYMLLVLASAVFLGSESLGT
jgi:hypothetical protein